MTPRPAKSHLPVTANGKSVVLAMDRLFREGYDGLRDAGASRHAKAVGAASVQSVSRTARPQQLLGLRRIARLLLASLSREARHRPSLSHGISFRVRGRVPGYEHRAGLLLRALYLPTGDANLFVVADEDQTIYQWNGASPNRLAALRSHYGMDTIQLPQSYRCPPPVVALANKLIGCNQSRPAGKAPAGFHERWGGIQFGSFGQSFADAETKRSG